MVPKYELLGHTSGVHVGSGRFLCRFVHVLGFHSAILGKCTRKSRLVETLRFRIYTLSSMCRQADTSSIDLVIWVTLKRVAMHSAGVESRLMGLLRVAVMAHHERARGVLERMACSLCRLVGRARSRW